MTVPRPDQLTDQWGYLTDNVLPRTVDNYRWAYPLGYEHRTGSSIRGSGTSAPTETAVIAREAIRSHTQLAARLLEKAAACIRGADAALARALDADDPSREHTPDPYHDGRLRLVANSELEAARQAQTRRGRRGEGWGSS
jgi:hypothetical protein